MIRIIHQRAKCIGCSACVVAANYRWRMSRRDGKCTLVDGVEKQDFYSVLVGDDELSHVISAAKNCPVNIIKFEKVE